MENYKEFYGSNVKQMSKLLAEGFVPASTAEIMKHRINNEEFFVNKYIDTSDLMAYDSKDNSDNVKFILTVDNKNKITDKGREALELIHYSNKKLFQGYINLNGQYSSLEGIEVSRNDVGKVEQYLTQNEILNSKAWRILARHPDEVPKEFAEDEKLLEEYSKWVQSKTKDTKNMEVYLGSQSGNEGLRAWYLNNLEGGYDAGAWNDLVKCDGRFVGLAAEPQEVSLKNGLESKVVSAIKAKKPFEYNGTVYVPVSDENIELKNKLKII